MCFLKACDGVITSTPSEEVFVPPSSLFLPPAAASGSLREGALGAGARGPLEGGCGTKWFGTVSSYCFFDS